MSKRLKDIYSEEFFEDFLERFSSIYPIKKSYFLSAIFTDSWNRKELKDRIKHIAVVLESFLPISYSEQTELIKKFVKANADVSNSDWRLGYLFLPEFVEKFGLNHYENSISAIEEITKFSSCEFAIRPFILQNPQKTIAQMLAWSKHEHYCVRRLASEGCRPKLPWAQKLQFLIEDPTEIFPILENLKTDDSDFVRKSVANNLNDISKSQPEKILTFAAENIGKTKNTDKILKHALRTLLKQGNAQAMELFGFKNNANISLLNTEFSQKVSAENPLNILFTLQNNEKTTKTIRLEYAIFFLRKNGEYSRKVFFIAEKECAPNKQIQIKKTHSFKPINTRTYYKGKQYISIIANGQEYKKASFLYS